MMDVIASENDMALKNSMRQLQGSVSDKIKDLRAKILYEIAFIESALDDPEISVWTAIRKNWKKKWIS